MRWIKATGPDYLAHLNAADRVGLRRCVKLINGAGGHVIIRKKGTRQSIFLKLRNNDIDPMYKITPLEKLEGMVMLLCEGMREPIDDKKLRSLVVCADMHHFLIHGKTISRARYEDFTTTLPRPLKLDLAIGVLGVRKLLEHTTTETAVTIRHFYRTTNADFDAIRLIFTKSEQDTLRDVVRKLRAHDNVTRIAVTGKDLLMAQNAEAAFFRAKSGSSNVRK
jgi:hypothetical protein